MNGNNLHSLIVANNIQHPIRRLSESRELTGGLICREKSIRIKKRGLRRLWRTETNMARAGFDRLPNASEAAAQLCDRNTSVRDTAHPTARSFASRESHERLDHTAVDQNQNKQPTNRLISDLYTISTSLSFPSSTWTNGQIWLAQEMTLLCDGQRKWWADRNAQLKLIWQSQWRC